MLREILTKSPLLYLPIGSLFLFLGVFTAVSIWLWKWPPSEAETAARLPLSGDSGGDA